MRRQLETGAVVRRVFDVYVDQAPVLMPAAAVVFVFTGIVATLLVVASASLTIVALLIDLVATALFTGMIVELVADVRDGRRDASVGQLLRAVSPVAGQLILVSLVAGVAVLVGLVLFVLPGLAVLTVWSVFAPVVVLERPDGLRALARSRELVSGQAWRVFVVVLIFFILPVVISYALEIAAATTGTGLAIVVRVVLGVLTAPFAALASAVMYFELRDLQAPARGPAVPDERVGSFQAGPFPPDSP